MFGKNKQKTVVAEPSERPDELKAPQQDAGAPPCINRMNPAVKIELTGVQLDIEHAWENGYNAGAPGFWTKLFTALLGSGIISILTMGITSGLKYVAMLTAEADKSGNVQKTYEFTQQEILLFLTGLICFVVGGLVCLVLHARKPSKDEYVKDVMAQYHAGK